MQKDEVFSLIIDIGNSSIAFGFFLRSNLIAKIKISTREKYTNEQYYSFLREAFDLQTEEKLDRIIFSLKKVVISSVVPHLTPIIDDLISEYFKKEAIILKTTDAGLDLYTNGGIGTDCIADAKGMLEFYSDDYGVVVDLGTATTFTVIQKKGSKLLNVTIAPGIGISVSSLIENTALLPDIAIKKPSVGLLHNSTTESMQAGLYYGYVSMIEGMVEKLSQTFNLIKPLVVLTGGFSGLFYEKDFKIPVQINSDLTLLGIFSIYSQMH